MTKNLHKELSFITREERENRTNIKALTLWMTGLSGAGKSTISKHVERILFDEGILVYRLDGDNLRTGLNKDLGFSLEDRGENIRRSAEVAHLFNDAGVIVICSLISPLTRDREMARSIIGADRFLEVYVKTELAECERRDPHGLYAKARAGEIGEFTGISSPYEVPQNPWMQMDTQDENSEELAGLIVSKVLDIIRCKT